MITNARIVVLNGVGSVGKSSIARAHKSIAAEPFLHVQMDTFISMLPESYDDHRDGFSYDTVCDHDGSPMVIIKTGPVGERVLRGTRRSDDRAGAMAIQSCPQGQEV